MMDLQIFFYTYFILLGLFYLIVILVFIFIKKQNILRKEFQPKISVLLAVRNESRNILSCLQFLSHLDYPPEKLEVLIGDDLSEDDTVSIVENFIKGHSNFHLYLIKDKIGMAGAKGNVLAQLAPKATGDFFFITDADVHVPSTWVYGLLSGWKEGIATVSGSAIISGKSLLSRFQSIDWITAFGMIYTSSSAGIPVTAVGNNMMVKREAYFETGGYENIPFSVTEDFDLHEALRKLGWKHINLLNPFVLTTTKPIVGFWNILQQRKRWMHGAVRLSPILVTLLSLQAVFFPMLLLALFYFPFVTSIVWIVKIILQGFFLYVVLKRAEQPHTSVWVMFLYEIYSGLCSFLLIIYYFLPLKTDWKGRKYA